MRLLDSVHYHAKLRWLRRNEYESVPLRAWFASAFDVEVGLYSYGCFDRQRMRPRTRIGRYCSFAQTAIVVDRNHPASALSTHPYLYEPHLGLVDRGLDAPEPLVISDDVWVGHNAIILPGCKAIGRGAIIGAGSVVTHDVPAYAIVAGNPARLLRMRFNADLVAAVEQSRWWDMDRASLARLNREHPKLLRQPSIEGLAMLLSQGHRA